MHGSTFPGAAFAFQIAGLRFGFEIAPTLSGVFEPPAPFAAYRVGDEDPPDVTVRIQDLDTRAARFASLLYDSGVNWRARKAGDRYLFEWYHPPTSGVLLHALTRPTGNRIEIGFDASLWSRLRGRDRTSAGAPRFSLLPPFEQLPFLVPFARRQSFLVHGCGAVLDGRAYVFAGHSGDGKTSLARLLASEGAELLSDERVALRKRGEGFEAFGTPWAGEGRVISTKSYPLAAAFLLYKGTHHHVRSGRPARLATELLARSIVPYYLRVETDLILSLVDELLRSVPLRELHFALSGGVRDVLLRAQILQ
jgi:hypothetical protein